MNEGARKCTKTVRVWGARCVAICALFGVMACKGDRFGDAPGRHVDLEDLRTKILRPLPESTFVGTGMPCLESANRDWNALDDGFKEVLISLFFRMEERGFPLVLLEGFRSEEQDRCVNPRAYVPNPPDFGSLNRHHFRAAAYVAPFRNGRPQLSPENAWTQEAFKALAEEAARLDLVWGGASAGDPFGRCHVYWRMNQLRAWLDALSPRERSARR